MLPYLRIYPNREMAQLLINGFNNGFFVPEFRGSGCQWVDNLQSVNLNLSVVSEKIQKEIEEGRVEGPFSSPPFPNFRLSPLGLVPKKDPGCYRLIHHLSFPAKQSLNDDIDKSVSSVEYSSFDNALALLQRFGQGCFLAGY